MAKQKPPHFSAPTPASIVQLLAQATQQHQAGQLTAAAQIYRQILQHHPNQVDALHFLGVIALQTGQWQEAIAQCQAALALKPDLLHAHIHLAHALRADQQPQQAIAHYQQALSLKPDLAEIHLALGNVLYEVDQRQEAIAHYQQALQWQPELATAHYNLGRVLQSQGQVEAALQHYQQAIAIDPRSIEALSNLGNLLMQQQRVEEAIGYYQKAIAIHPHAGIYLNLGKATEALGNREGAIALYHRALQLNPNLAEAHNNLGDLYRDQNQMAAAINHYQQAIALNPTLAEAHSNLGMAFLRIGDWKQGFEGYEWRWRCSTSSVFGCTGSPWDGSNLSGKTILLLSEQGFGDAIQFVRYVPLIRAQADRVILQCAQPLVRLFSTLAGLDEVISDGSALPNFDVYAALGSLPYLFKTTLETIPSQIPYLTTLSQESSLTSLLTASAAPLKVGLVWAGKPQHCQDPSRNRSCPLHFFAPLLQLPEFNFYSLQKETPAQEIYQLGWEKTIQDLNPYLTDFADTATAIAHLDLVITVDTAVAHLAGALGQPVWVLLPFAAEWRWMLDRTDSPWYSTMRLIRQSQPGDWQSVIQQVMEG